MKFNARDYHSIWGWIIHFWQPFFALQRLSVVFSWFWSSIKIFIYIWFDRELQALQVLYEPYLLLLLLWNGKSRFVLPLKSKSAIELPIITEENFSIFAFYILNKRSSRVILKSKILGHLVLSVRNKVRNNDFVPVLDPQNECVP